MALELTAIVDRSQEAHLLTARLSAPGGPDSVPFPFLCLLASGGHTMLVLAKVRLKIARLIGGVASSVLRIKLTARATHCPQSLGDYVRLGSTLDDAVGEAFDKVARDLELPWMVDGVSSAPGAALEALASKGMQAHGLASAACTFSHSDACRLCR